MTETAHRTHTLEELLASNANEHAFARRVHTLGLRALLLELRGVLEEMGKARGWGDEGLSSTYPWDCADGPKHAKEIADRGFPTLTDATTLDEIRYRWICVFPVTGGSEGHYIHVDLIWQNDYREGRVPLFMIKTFGGHAEAIQIAGELCRLLGV